MQKKMWALLGATMMTGAAFMMPAARADEAVKTDKTEATKTEKAEPTEVRVCPMTGEAVVGNGSGSQMVGAYKVFFCCGGCKGEFNKLTKAEQTRRVEKAVKTQEENAKDAKKEDK